MFESSQFVRRILGSTKMSLSGKKTVIKFLEKIRMMVIAPRLKWKEKDLI